MLPVLVCLFLGAAPQDPAALIQGLRSEDIAVRERAFVELEKLGAAAEADLKKVAGDPDAHVADSARRLLLILELERKISPKVKAALPGVVRRLAMSRSDEWTEAYLHFAGSDADDNATRDDLAPLAVEAIRGALDSKSKIDACDAAVGWFHRGAKPAIVGLLKDPDKEVRNKARQSLEDLLGSDAYPIFVTELESEPAFLVEALAHGNPVVARPWMKKFTGHSDPRVAVPAIQFLTRAKVRDSVDDVRAVLKSGPPEAKVQALEYLKSMKSKETIKSIGPLLQDADADVREHAVKALSSFGITVDEATSRRLLGDDDQNVASLALSRMDSNEGRGLIPEVRNLARDPSTGVFWSAANALLRWKDPKVIDILLDVFRHGPPDDQIPALELLGEGDPSLAADPVRSILEDTRLAPEARRAALRALIQMEAVPPNEKLISLVRSGDAGLAVDSALQLSRSSPDLVRSEIPRLLQSSPREVLRTNDYGSHDEGSRISKSSVNFLKLADPANLAPVLVGVLHESDTLCERAAHAIGELGFMSAEADLRVLLNSEKAPIAMAATRALAQLKSEKAQPEILKLLKSPDKDVRCVAVYALAEFGFDSAIEELRRLTRDPEQEVREAAVFALVKHRVRDAIPDLIRLLDDETNLAERAARGLVEMGCRDHVPHMLKWAISGIDNRRNVAEEVLTVIRPAEAAPVVERMLDHRDVSVRRRGIWLVQALGLKGLCRKISEGLGEPMLADKARAALVELDARELIPDLRAMVTGPDPVRRAYAIHTLAGLEDAESAPLIRRFLLHTDYWTRLQAMVAAGRLKDREAAPDLVKGLRDPEWNLWLQSAESLDEIGEPAPAESLLALLRDPILPWWHPVWELMSRHRQVELIPALRRQLQEASEANRGEIAKTLAALGAKEAIPDFLKIVDEGKELDDTPAALAILGAKEALPVLRRALENYRDYRYAQIAQAMADLGDLSALENPRTGHLEEQMESARLLCLRGDRRGVPKILSFAGSQHQGYSILNAVRNPVSWKALSERSWRGDFEGTKIHVLNRLAAVAGVKIRWEKGSTFNELIWPYGWTRSSRSWRTLTLLRAITSEITGEYDLVCAEDGPAPTFSFILDSDEIRILPTRDAAAFWRQWWADEQAKLKK